MESPLVTSTSFGLGWPALAITSVLLAVFGPSLYTNFVDYLRFFIDHEAFYNEASRTRKPVLPFKAPWPGTFPLQYFLLNQETGKAMFATSPSLDFRKSIDVMHENVWNVPEIEGREVTKAVEKISSSSMSNRDKIQSTIQRFEDALLGQLRDIRAQVGRNGAKVPLGHKTYSLMWTSASLAFYGPGLDPRSIRQPSRDFIHNANIVYEVSFLPILPTALWYRLLPKARLFLKGREELRQLCEDYMNDKTAVAGGADNMRAFCKLFEEGKDQCSMHIASSWMAMFLTGLLVNSSEVLGWLFSYLLQSPKYLELVKAECDAVAGDSLVDVDFKSACPYLYSAVQETLRLKSAVFAGRTVKKDLKLPGIAKTFKPGSFLRIMSPAVGRDRSFWGDDALAWRGDRFHAGGDQLYAGQMAFGGGATACPGRVVAAIELCLTATHLFRNFEIGNDFALHEHLPDIGDDMTIGARLTAKPATAEIIDADGKVLHVDMPRMENYGCEIPSGVLGIQDEIVVTLKPKETGFWG